MLQRPCDAEPLLLGHRLRHWSNIKPTVGQLLVFTGQRIPIGIQTCNQQCVSHADSNVTCSITGGLLIYCQNFNFLGTALIKGHNVACVCRFNKATQSGKILTKSVFFFLLYWSQLPAGILKNQGFVWCTATD